MKSLYTVILFSLLTLTLCTYVPPEEDPSCDCDYCNKEEALNKEAKTETVPSQSVHTKDNDSRSRTICARDRDFDDKTFASVCHMSCYNRCTRLRYLTAIHHEPMRYSVNAYRTNYYKLRDGAC